MARLFRSPRTRRGSVLALLGLGAAFVGEPSSASPPRYSDSPYSVTLEDDQGNALRTFHHDGTTFVLGYLDERYDVRIENHTDRRVEAVLSVDGRDAVSGAVGDFVHERGYIVGPHGSVRVDGFRRSLDETAAFRFSSPSSSYSARMGTPENVGVIGVAFFPERRAPARRPPWRAWREDRRWYPPTTSSPYDGSASAAPPAAAPNDEPLGGAAKRAAPSPAASAEARGSGAPRAARRTAGVDAYRERRREAWKDDREGRDEEGPSRLGTEYGESRFSPVTEVPFERQSSGNPAVILSVRYDDAEGLLARGIEVYPRPYWAEPAATYPDPFPANRFAPPPP